MLLTYTFWGELCFFHWVLVFFFCSGLCRTFKNFYCYKLAVQDLCPTSISFVLGQWYFMYTLEKSVTFVCIALGGCLLKNQLRKQSCDPLSDWFSSVFGLMLSVGLVPVISQEFTSRVC